MAKKLNVFNDRPEIGKRKVLARTCHSCGRFRQASRFPIYHGYTGIKCNQCRRKRRLTDPVKGVDYGFLPQEDPSMWKIVDFIKKNPGCDKAEISLAFPGFEAQELNNRLLKARRNRGLIENRGTRTYPRWFLSQD